MEDEKHLHTALDQAVQSNQNEKKYNPSDDIGGEDDVKWSDPCANEEQLYLNNAKNNTRMFRW